MNAWNGSAVKRNELVLNDLPDNPHTKEATDKIPDDFKYPLAKIQAVQNQKQTNKGGLEKSLKLIIDAKVMLTVNLDKQDCLINDQTRNFSYTEFSQGCVGKVCTKFSDEQTGLQKIRSSYLVR